MQVNRYKSFLSKHTILSYLIVLVITYVLLSPLMLAPLYDWMLFHPDREYHFAVDKPLQKIAAKFKTHKQDILIPVSNKRKIYAWYFREPTAERTFLISHGNGGNICYRLALISALLKYGSVLIYDYEGYGKSEGVPSRQAICADGLAAYDYLVNSQHIRPKDVILYGESLGCSVSCHISKYRPVGGLILQSGWASLLEAARDRFILPRLYPDCLFAEPLLDNTVVLKRPHPAVLLIHGQQDKILPCRYSQELFAHACEPKQLVLLPNASHNNIGIEDNSLYFQSILNFLASIRR